LTGIKYHQWHTGIVEQRPEIVGADQLLCVRVVLE